VASRRRRCSLRYAALWCEPLQAACCGVRVGCVSHGGKLSTLRGLDVGEENAVGAQDVSLVAEELDLVEVGRQVVGRLVLHKNITTGGTDYMYIGI